jgi:D12 class N6 adenine-specific DNA methyltransferase
MFSYYGSKSKLAKYYSEPSHDTIIEPFAGSAAYSLYGERWKKQVFLYDIDEIIVGLWHYLIKVHETEIINLPNVEYRQSIDEFTLTQEQKWLMGFCINRGSSHPKKKVQKFQSWNRKKIQIAENLYKIRHWKMELKSYLEIENKKATWFIDPPYQEGGKYYTKSKIDYSLYKNWLLGREGQIIGCDLTTANYLDFKPLRQFKGQLHSRMEGVFYLSV